MKVGWETEDGNTQVARFDLTKLYSPLTYQFSWVTPWNSWKTMQGKLILDKLTAKYGLEVANNAALSLVPLNVKMWVSGSKLDFNHNAILNWNSPSSRSISLGLSGSINGILQTNVSTYLRLSKLYDIQLNTVSKLEPKNYVAGIKGSFNDNDFETGLRCSGEMNKKDIRVWASLPSGRNYSAAATYEGSSNEKRVSLHIQDKSSSLLRISGTVIQDPSHVWSFRTSMESSVALIPSITLESATDLSDASEIRHQSKLKFSSLEGTYWAKIPVNDLSLDCVLNNLELLSGNASWNDKNLRIEGSLLATPNGHHLKTTLSSTEFLEIHIEGSYQLSEDVASFEVGLKHDAKSLLKLDISANEFSGTYSFTAFLSSVMTPTLDGSFTMDPERGVGEVFLKQNEIYALYLNGTAQVN
jgi:hypothetical protein